LGENFTQIPNEVLRGSLLTPSEKLVWIIIKSHEWNGDGCWPSATLIAKESGYHRATVIRAVKALEEKEVISVKRTHGQSNQYHCATSSIVLPVASCDGGSSMVLPDQSHHATPPVASCDTNKTQEEDSIIRPKKKTQPRPSKQEQLEQIKEAFPEFQEQFPFRNVPQMYEQWLDWMEEKGKRPSNYKSSFRNFLRLKDWEKNLKAQIEDAARGSPSHGRKTMSQWIKEHSE